MKKILIASTALVATAGIAAAEVNYSGAAGFGFIYDGFNWSPDFDTTLSVAMTGETDGGLSFGANLDLTFDNGGPGETDGQVVYIEGGFGKLSVGTVGSAVDAKLGISDIGYSGLGVDNRAESIIDDNDDGNIMYDGSFGDFGVAMSIEMGSGTTDNFSIAATYAMGDYNFGVGYDDAESVISVKAGGSFGDIALNALYSRSSDTDEDAFGIHAAYTMGAATISAAYADSDREGEAYGLGISYDLGGGASVDAGVAEVAGITWADLGINMTF